MPAAGLGKAKASRPSRRYLTRIDPGVPLPQTEAALVDANAIFREPGVELGLSRTTLTASPTSRERGDFAKSLRLCGETFTVSPVEFTSANVAASRFALDEFNGFDSYSYPLKK
jgi:hypothetical protein